MTNDERTEGARAIAAVMIGNGVAWDTLSEQVQARCATAYEAAVATRERAEWEAYVRLPSALLRRKWGRRERGAGDDA